MTEEPDPKSAEGAVLSRELSKFLIEFSIGVHRCAIYPPDHPALAPVVQNILASLGELFVHRQHLSIGVAARQLIIEGVATDTEHPVLSDLARRLHSHQLGAVSFQLGVNVVEISQLLGALAEDCERDNLPLGMREGDEFPSWEHARLYKVGYDKLELRSDEGEAVGHMDQATELWLGLARAALSSEEPMDESPGAAVIARSIESHARGDAYDQAIVGYLLQIADELKDTDTREAAKIRGRVSGLMNELDEDTLARLVDFGGNPAQRRKFVLDANESLAVDSVLKVLGAAASSSGQTISTSMTRMLSKMAVHAGRGAPTMRTQADTALRQNVEALMEGWELTDPNPEAYTSVLDAMSRSAPILNTPDTVEDLAGSKRILEMALEVDAFGPTVEKALFDLAKDGRVDLLFRMMEGAPEGNAVATHIMQHLTGPDRFRQILEEGQVDITVINALVSEMGESAADPLLDVLTDSESRSLRRSVFDILAGLGTFVGPRAIERLDDARWHVQRNMLALLEHHTYVLEGFDLAPYLDHDDARVRQEALPLALLPGSPLRDLALVSSLSDDDERMVRMGLLALQESVPDAAVATLVHRVVAVKERSVEMRALAAKALGNSSVGLGRTALIDVVTGGKTWLGKPKLTRKSALTLAALRALNLAWTGHPHVEPILGVARRSKDPEIRATAQPAESGVG